MIYNKHIIVMIGNIGSGKSTVVETFVNKHGFLRISRDAFRYMLNNYVWKSELEHYVWELERFAAEILMEAKLNIIVDEVGVSKRLRLSYIMFAKEYGYTIAAYVMPRLSKEESIKRRLQKPHGNQDAKMWEEVWERFDKTYEDPSFEEGFDTIIDHDKGERKKVL